MNEYTLGRLWDEVSHVENRLSAFAASHASLASLAYAATQDKKANKAFTKQLREMMRGQ